MDKDEKLEYLDNLFQNIIKPLDNMPFETIIKGLSGYELLPFDEYKNANFLKKLRKAIDLCNKNIKNSGGIESARPNEVGNYMEQPVIDAINQLDCGLVANKPRTASGKVKNSGYPDIVIEYDNIFYYLEIKTYNVKSKASAFRSFYLSPSDEFKVTHDGHHLLLAFEMEFKNLHYWPTAFKLITLEHLKCQVKHEFNANNKDLYQDKAILLEGKL